MLKSALSWMRELQFPCSIIESSQCFPLWARTIFNVRPLCKSCLWDNPCVIPKRSSSLLPWRSTVDTRILNHVDSHKGCVFNMYFDMYRLLHSEVYFDIWSKHDLSILIRLNIPRQIPLASLNGKNKYIKRVIYIYHITHYETTGDKNNFPTIYYLLQGMRALSHGT